MKNAIFFGISLFRRWTTTGLCCAVLTSVAAPCGAQEGAEPAPEQGSLADVREPEWTEEPKPTKRVFREGVVLVPSVGLAIAGSGTMKEEVECLAGTCASESESVEADYDQNQNILLGFDTLYHVLPSLRLGLGLQWMPTSEVDVDGADSNAELGSELATTAVIEGVFGGKSAGAVRGFIGPNFIFPGGDLEDGIDEIETLCSGIASAGGSCSVEDGPYMGLTLGAAAAFLSQITEGAALRIELSLQYLRVSGPSVEVSDTAGTRIKDTLSWSATRLALRFGVEF